MPQTGLTVHPRTTANAVWNPLKVTPGFEIKLGPLHPGSGE